MKKIKFLSAIIAAVAGFAFSSCLGDGSTRITTERNLSGSQNFSYITDLQTNEEYIVGTGANYSMSLESTELTFGLYATGLQVKAGGGSYTFRIKDIKYKYDKFGAIQVSIPNYTDSENNVVISDFDLNYQQRSIGYMNMDIYTMTYTLDNRFKIRVIQTSIFYFGDTEIKEISTSEIKETNRTSYYCIAVDPKTLDGKKMDASLWVYNILIPGQKAKTNYNISEPLYITYSSNGYTLEGINVKVFEDGSKTPSSLVASNVQGNGTYLLRDDGEKRQPNLLLGITIDNQYRINASVGYSFTKELADQFSGLN